MVKKHGVIILFICLASVLSSCSYQKTLKGSAEGANLTINYEIFPDSQKTIVKPGEKVVFKLTPRMKDKNIKGISFCYGDNECDEKSFTYKKGQCAPLYFTHSYKKRGVYLPEIQYHHGNNSENITFDGKKIIISNPLTDRELLEEMYKKMSDELVAGIDETIASIKTSGQKTDYKLAFTSFNNANYESSDNISDRIGVNVIQNIIKNVVKKQKYTVLERTPQVLIPLAHNSVGTFEDYTKPESEKNKWVPLDRLDYGLKTKFIGSEQPFDYAVKLEGVDDEMQAKSQGKSGIEKDEEFRADEKGITIKRKFIESAGSDRNQKSDFSRKRPLLFAQFDTADLVIAIDVIIPPVVLYSDPIYYDDKSEASRIKRTAHAVVNARIIATYLKTPEGDKEPEGNKDVAASSILWIKDIAGETSDMISPEIAKYLKEKKDIFIEKLEIRDSLVASKQEDHKGGYNKFIDMLPFKIDKSVKSMKSRVLTN